MMSRHCRVGFCALLCSIFFMVGAVWSPSLGVAADAEFAYSGDIGPGFWSSLNKDWAACRVDPADLPTARQSPVNIDFVHFDLDLEALDLHLEDTEINLINNGHTIEQEYEEGSTVDFEGREYQLLQFHFHTLSEHAVRGKRGVMELHAVFLHESSGELLVIGQLYKLGETNAFLAQFDGRLPRKEGVRKRSRRHINLADGLTNTHAYYTYPGSLTTPPCSPIVTWIVLKQPATMSKEQFHVFQGIMGNNFRPLQALSERKIRATLDDFAGHRK